MSKCPSCGAKAYVGFTSVECSNDKCEHFEMSFALATMMEEEVDTQPVPVYSPDPTPVQWFGIWPGDDDD